MSEGSHPPLQKRGKQDQTRPWSLGGQLVGVWALLDVEEKERNSTDQPHQYHLGTGVR